MLDFATSLLRTIDSLRLVDLSIDPTMVRLIGLSKLTKYLRILKIGLA